MSADLDAIWETEDPTLLQQRIAELDANLGNATRVVRERIVRPYERHPGIARLVKQRQKYICQLCGYIGFAMRKATYVIVRFVTRFTLAGAERHCPRT